MKFSFINPRANLSDHTAMPSSSLPLGILYIASLLQSFGIEVSLLDHAASGDSVEQVVDWVMQEDPDIVGFSTLISSSITAPQIAQAIKRDNPDIITVLGNHHATFNAERILQKYPFVDVIVRGEGEHTCVELAKWFQGKCHLKDVLGITFRQQDQIVSNPNRPVFRDVDSLPFPDRDLFDFEYHNVTMGINIAPKRFTSFLSGRGCPYNCRFCSCTSMAHNVWRPRSLENILEELHLLSSEGYQQLLFVDDTFTSNAKRVINLCREMRIADLDFEWICEGRVDHVSYRMFREMANAGCRMVYFGVESAHQKVLDYYNKKTTPQQAEQAIAAARKAGIDVIVASFIVGAPNETRADVQYTLDWSQQLDIDIPQINILQANPGTPLWDEFTGNGFLDPEQYWETGVFISDISPDAVPVKELVRMIRNYYQKFLKDSPYILKQVLRTIRSSYRRNLFFHNVRRIKAISQSLNRLTLM